MPEDEKTEIKVVNEDKNGTSSVNSVDSRTQRFKNATEPEMGPPVPAHSNLAWSRFRANYQNFFSELFGVFTLILFGNGSVAQVVLSKGENGGYQSISWGWG
jgi:aquaglyceroporin related protein